MESSLTLLVTGQSLQEVVRSANLAGVFSFTRLGAQLSLPTREQLIDFDKA